MTPMTSISKVIRVVPLKLTVPLTCRALYMVHLPYIYFPHWLINQFQSFMIQSCLGLSLSLPLGSILIVAGTTIRLHAITVAPVLPRFFLLNTKTPPVKSIQNELWMFGDHYFIKMGINIAAWRSKIGLFPLSSKHRRPRNIQKPLRASHGSLFIPAITWLTLWGLGTCNFTSPRDWALFGNFLFFC